MRAMNKKSLFWWTLLGCISGYYCQVNAQSAYHINLDIPDKIIETGHLDLGGVAPDGGSISVNSYYMELNKSPFIRCITYEICFIGCKPYGKSTGFE